MSRKETLIKLRELCRKEYEYEEDGGDVFVKGDVDPYGEVYKGLEKAGCLDVNYSDNRKKRKAKNVSDFTFNDCCTELTFLLRGERFSPGTFYDALKDKTVFKLLERAVEVMP